MRSDTLGTVVKRANENLAKRDLPPLAAEIALVLKVYAQTMRRGGEQLAQLPALVDGEKARRDTKADLALVERAKSAAA